MAYTIDKHDLKLLQKLADDGPCFLTRTAQEFRALEMRRAGYIDGEMTVYSMHAGKGSTSFRLRYSITDKGRALLLPTDRQVKP